MPPPSLGDHFPDFTAESHQGTINWHEYINGSWAVLFSHPADYTPVCTTELGTVQELHRDFSSRGVKCAALSCNDTASHTGWVADILAFQQLAPAVADLSFPIIADPQRELAHKLGMLDEVAKDAAGLPMTCRAVFIIGPDKKLKLSLLYPASTGRNFAEILRVIDSLQLTAKYSVATPANWNTGDKCMVLPSLSTDEARQKFPRGVEVLSPPSRKPYLRFTPDPRFSSAASSCLAKCLGRAP